MISTRFCSLLFLIFSAITFSCTKSTSSGIYRLNYGDSIFYIGNQPTDVLAAPLNPRTGRFSSFPDGLVLDPNTGVINVSQSDAGMKYRINFLSSTGDSSTTFVVISGINFPDKYYRIESGDTMALPVYNANASNNLPSGSFDDDRVANSSGCAMRTNNGTINIAESIRNGIFGTTPKNDTRRDFDVKYRLDDKSQRAQNKIKILIYYYDRLSDVPATLK